MRGIPRIAWLVGGALAADALVLWLLRDLPLYRRGDADAPPPPGPAAFLIEAAPPARPDPGKAAPPASPRFTVPSQTVASPGAPAPALVPAGAAPSPAPAGSPAASAAGAPASAALPGQASLFNLTVPSRRVVYLVDASGSMLDRLGPGDARSRYEAAGQEVRRSLAALPPDAAFDVVLFADRTVALAPAALPPTPEARARAEALLGRLPDDLGGGTDLVGGLAAAWKLNPDAVFLLTDGGATEAEWKLVREFAAVQAASPTPTRLYAFGLASPMDDNGDRLLLKLCAMTGGSYQGLESYRK